MAKNKVKLSEEEKTSTVTLLGPGGLAGTWRFAEFAGVVNGKTEEEAIKNAEELAAKHPALLVQ